MPTTVKAPCLSSLFAAGLVRGPELVAHFQPELLGRGGPGHGVEIVVFVVAEVPALGELVLLVAVIVSSSNMSGVVPTTRLSW